MAHSKTKQREIEALAASLTDEQVRDLLDDNGAGSLRRSAAHKAMQTRPSLWKVREERHNRQATLAAERSQRNLLQIEAISTALLAAGYILDHQSDVSRYFVKDATAIRVSDHYVPETAEREFNAANGGFSWSRGLQIVVPVANVEAAVAEIIEAAESN